MLVLSLIILTATFGHGETSLESKCANEGAEALRWIESRKTIVEFMLKQIGHTEKLGEADSRLLNSRVKHLPVSYFLAHVKTPSTKSYLRGVHFPREWISKISSSLESMSKAQVMDLLFDSVTMSKLYFPSEVWHTEEDRRDLSLQISEKFKEPELTRMSHLKDIIFQNRRMAFFNSEFELLKQLQSKLAKICPSASG